MWHFIYILEHIITFNVVGLYNITNHPTRSKFLLTSPNTRKRKNTKNIIIYFFMPRSVTCLEIVKSYIYKWKQNIFYKSFWLPIWNIILFFCILFFLSIQPWCYSSAFLQCHVCTTCCVRNLIFFKKL